MSIVADVVAQFRADTSQFTDEVSNATDAVDKLGSAGSFGGTGGLADMFDSAGDSAGQLVEKVGAASQVLGQLDEVAEDTGSKIRNLATGALGLGTFAGLLASASTTTNELQTMKVQMNATFGAGGAGMMEQAIKYADQFGVATTQASAAFVAFGQATKGSSIDITNSMKSIADIAAGTGASVADLSNAIGNYYQIIQRAGGQGGAAGRYAQQLVTSHVITQEEANRLRLMANQGADPTTLVQSILSSGEQTYAGTGQAQANTLGNELQRFRNQFSDALAGNGGAFQPLFDSITKGLKSLDEWMQGDQFAGIVKNIQGFVGAIASAGVIIKPFVQDMLILAGGAEKLISSFGFLKVGLEGLTSAWLAYKALKIVDDFTHLGVFAKLAGDQVSAETSVTHLNTQAVQENTQAIMANQTATSVDVVSHAALGTTLAMGAMGAGMPATVASPQAVAAQLGTAEAVTAAGVMSAGTVAGTRVPTDALILPSSAGTRVPTDAFILPSGVHPFPSEPTPPLASSVSYTPGGTTVLPPLVPQAFPAPATTEAIAAAEMATVATPAFIPAPLSVSTTSNVTAEKSGVAQPIQTAATNLAEPSSVSNISNLVQNDTTRTALQAEVAAQKTISERLTGVWESFKGTKMGNWSTSASTLGPGLGIGGLIGGSALEAKFPNNPTASLAGGALQGAGMGFMIGSAFGGPEAGGAVGAGVGALAGIAMSMFTSETQRAAAAAAQLADSAKKAANAQDATIMASAPANLNDIRAAQVEYQTAQRSLEKYQTSAEKVLAPQIQQQIAHPGGGYTRAGLEVINQEAQNAKTLTTQEASNTAPVKGAQQEVEKYGAQLAAINNNTLMIERLAPSLVANNNPNSAQSQENVVAFAKSAGIDLTKKWDENAQAVNDATLALVHLGNSAAQTAEQLTNKLGFEATQIAGQQGQGYVNLGVERKTDTNGNPLPFDTGTVGHLSYANFNQLAQQSGINLMQNGTPGFQLAEPVPGVSNSSGYVAPQRLTEQNYNTPQLTTGQAQLTNSFIMATQQLRDAVLTNIQAQLGLTQAILGQQSARSNVNVALQSGYTPQFANFAQSLVGIDSVSKSTIAAMTNVIDQYNAIESALNGVRSETQNYSENVRYGSQTFTANISAGQSLATQFTKLSDVVGLVQAQMQVYQNTLGQTLAGTKAYNQAVENETVAAAGTSKSMALLELAGYSTSSPEYINLQRQQAIQQAQSTVTQSTNTQTLGVQQFQISQAQIGREVGYQTMLQAAQGMGQLKTQLYQANQNLAPLNLAYIAQNNNLKEAAPKAQAVATAAANLATADQGLRTASNSAKDATNNLTTSINTFKSTISQNFQTVMSEISSYVNEIGLAVQGSAKGMAAMAQEFQLTVQSMKAISGGNIKSGESLQYAVAQIQKAGSAQSASQINTWVQQFNSGETSQTRGATNVGHFAPYQQRAGGGPTDANTPYIVGENGPEIMIPGAGYIIPNQISANTGTALSTPYPAPSPTISQSSGSITVAPGAVQVAIEMNGGVKGSTPQELSQEISSVVNDALNQIVQKWNGK